MKPWLSIPLNDYERHMNSEAVQQSGALAELFAQALVYCRPESVAILGVAGGNGLENINPAVTRRVCGIDLNPAYLEQTRQRFQGLPGLELCCIDLAEKDIDVPPVQLVHGALIFEHAGMGRCLQNALKMVADEGNLAVVLQLPSRTQEENIGSQSPASIQALRGAFRLIEPGQFCQELEQNGFMILHELEEPLASGKAFWMGVFARNSSRD